jgi:hypothetical protein
MRISAEGWSRIGALPKKGDKKREDELNAECIMIATTICYQVRGAAHVVRMLRIRVKHAVCEMWP